LLALLLFFALALELRLLAPFFLLKPFELSLFVLFFEPPLLFGLLLLLKPFLLLGLLLLLELLLLLGLALLRLEELIELLLLLRSGRGPRGVRRWRWGRCELFFGLFLGLLRWRRWWWRWQRGRRRGDGSWGLLLGGLRLRRLLR